MSDLIRRDEAIRMLDEYIKPFVGLIGDMGSSINGAREIIKSIPTAEPKVGKWVRITQDVGIRPHQYMCSECHRIIEYSSSESPQLLIMKYPYCHCGAKMERSE